MISHILSSRLRTVAVASVFSLTCVFGVRTAVLAAPMIIPDALPAARVGVLYSQSPGLDAPLIPAATWSLTGGELPPGINFTANSDHMGALIKGTPTTVGTYSITIKVNNGASYDRMKTYAINVLPMAISERSLPNAHVGSSYSQTLEVLGGTAPYEWRVTGGQLPVGITLTTSGVITGTPLYALPYTFTAKVSDAAGRTADRVFDLTVDASALDISTESPVPPATVGSAYSLDLVATGGSPTYSWSVSGGSYLPPGLMLATNGHISGSPTTAGNYTFSVVVRDAVSGIKTKSFNINVSDASIATLTLTNPSVPNATVGTWYSQSFASVGGVAPYNWNFASGTLPPGITFSTNGTIYGTPTTVGTYSFHVEVFDARHAFVGRTFTIVVGPASTSGSTGGSTGGSSEVTTRLNNFARMGVGIHTLVKLPDDGNRNTQADSAVYYLGSDGRRHAFPNERVFFTWYTGFSGVRVISASDMASIPLGANATYKPGVKMVKFQSDSRVYVVAPGRALRPIASESAAVELYGSTWNRQIDDISDAFFLDYNISAETVSGLSAFNPTTVRGLVNYVSEVLP